MTETPRGRRPGSPDTRATILVAARTLFAERGFSGASIRAIAAEAGVDPALVHHYFGTKADLYAASLELPVSPMEFVAWSEVPPDQIGEFMARIFFSLWELPETRVVILGIIRGGLDGNEEAVRPFREFVTELVRDRLVELIGDDGAEERALGMVAQLVGTVMIRHVVKIEPFVSMSVDELVDLIGPRLQAYVDD